MRIYNGSYEIAKGLTFFEPSRFYDFELSEKSVKIYAIQEDPNNGTKIHGRIMKYNITSPMPDVLRMQIRHLQSPKTVKYKTGAHEESLNVEDNEKSIIVKSGLLSVEFDKNRWGYSFKANSLLTKSGKNSAGFLYDAGKNHYMTEKLSLGVGGVVYGMGERFSPFIRNGQHVKIWNTDAATESDLGYKNIPFYMTNKGYGIFVNTSSAVDFEVCTEDNNSVRFTAPLKELDYFLIYGPSPKDILNSYTALTGRPPLIPKWSLGLWLSTSFTTDYNEDVITEQIDGMFKRDIPLTVFHFDCFWMKERRWCNFLWDRDAFPEPENMLKRLKRKGLKICLWINPYISELSEIFQEGVEQDFFLKNREGEIYQLDWWQPGIALVDFSNPAACEWYKDKLRTLLEMGVDTFKTDFAESAPTDAVYYSGDDGSEMHNYYTYLYNKTVFELLEDFFGKSKAIVFARSATAGSQKFPVHWGGDSRTNYTSMSGQLRGGLSFGVSGGAFWSHDIGGFYGELKAGIFKRWIAFGLLSSHSRLHGDRNFRIPWNYGEETSKVLKYFTELRYKLMPYIYSTCYEASRTGTPVMRPMFMEFPEDPGCTYLDRQYMLGNSLLVAPVFNTGGDVEFYLPPGTWTNYRTGNTVKGGKWLTEKHDFYSLPLYVRENTILPEGPIKDAPLLSSLDKLTLVLYNPGAKARLVIFEDEEIEIAAAREKEEINITLSKIIPDLKIRLYNRKKSLICNTKNLTIKDTGD